MVTWVPGRHAVFTINRYRASASDFGLLTNTNIIDSDHTIFPSRGAKISRLTIERGCLIISNRKLCSHSPNQKNQKFPTPITFDDITPLNQPNNDQLLFLTDDPPYLRRSVPNLRFNQLVDILVPQSLVWDQCQTYSRSKSKENSWCHR